MHNRYNYITNATFAGKLTSVFSTKNACSNYYCFGFNGQEKETEIANTPNHYSAEFWMYDGRIGRRWNMDPKPIVGISDYATFGNNPTCFTDRLGDTVKITHRTGFLGVKKETLNYDGNKLFNSDGSAYSGKVKGFLEQATKALADINTTAEGSSMLAELKTSKNTFTIVKGAKNEFKENNRARAHSDQLFSDPNLAFSCEGYESKGIDLTGGSGGTIYWNPNEAQVWEQGGRVNRANVALGHELFHGLDANKGLLDSRTHLGITRNEWQAVYRENIMRQQMRLPLRTHYGTTYDQNTEKYSPEINILTPEGTPILPSWYKP